MAYTGVNWQNKPSTASPINAANLEIMDNGIVEADANATSAKTEVEGIRTGADGTVYQTAGEAVRAQIEELSENTVNIIKGKIQGRSINQAGRISADSGFDVFYGECILGKKYSLTSGDSSNLYAFYSSKPVAGSSAYDSTRYATSEVTVAAPINGYIGMRVPSGYQYAQIEEGEKRTPYIPTLTATDFVARNVANNAINSVETKIGKKIQIGVNLYDASKGTSGLINADGTISASSSYITSDYIPISRGQSVAINKLRRFLAFNGLKEAISESYVNASVSLFSYTATQDGYIRASLFVSESERNIIAYGTTVPDYEPYQSKTVPEDGIGMSNDMIADEASYLGNVLNGKKWVACGDSFTAGAFANSLTDDYTFTDSPYYGKYKVYPYFIGRRNKGLNVINEAIAGSTMGGGDGGTNPFSGTRYKNIPSDADYITLEFGINDSSNQIVPLGTIDDSDNTTFYGAWNVVLDYFRENFPFAHIGIIVGPGMQTSNGRLYAEAEIAIAKKWGIPYINIQFESGGGKIPLMLRTSNPDVADSVKEECDEKQYVNPNAGTLNLHPNEKAHEFESYFIEAWLRTL